MRQYENARKCETQNCDNTEMRNYKNGKITKSFDFSVFYCKTFMNNHSLLGNFYFWELKNNSKINLS